MRTRLLLLILFSPLMAVAQNTVSATITDLDGNAWAGGTYLISFQPSPSVPQISGQTVYSGALNGSGALSVSLPTASWNFQITPNASQGGFTSTQVITTTVSLTATLSALARGPRFPAGPNAYGYADIEVNLPIGTGTTYFNVATKTQRTWNGTAWQNGSGGGGGGTLIFPSGDATGVTDNAAIQAVITSGNTANLATGTFYISGLSWTAPSDLICNNSGGTLIYRTTTTTDFFNISYGGGEPNTESLGMTIRGCNLLMKNGVTPTAGYAFNLSGTSPTVALSGVHIENNAMFGLWGGLIANNYMVNNWYTNNLFDTGVSSTGSCININTVSPGGDLNVDGAQCVGSNAFSPVIIQKCDTMEFTNLKVNGGAGVVFTGVGSCFRPRFVNTSIENALTCAFDFGTGTQPINVEIWGGGVGVGNANAFCHVTATSSYHYAFMDYLTNDGNPGWISGPTENISAVDAAQTGSSSVAVTDKSATPVGAELAIFGQAFAVTSARGFAGILVTTNATNGILLSGTNAASGGAGVINMNPAGYDTGGNTAVFSGAATTIKNAVSLTGITGHGSKGPVCVDTAGVLYVGNNSGVGAPCP